MIAFLVWFTVVLFLSAIFINGFYLITKGEWETDPDSTKHYRGQIFCGWSKWLNTHTISRQFYVGEEFSKQLVKILPYIPNVTQLESTNGAKNAVLVQVLMPESRKRGLLTHEQEELRARCALLGVLVALRPFGEEATLVNIYREVEKYRLPDWIRKPMGGCITCMSSVFGTICWLFWTNLPTIGIFNELPLWARVLLWIFFCVSLSWVNEIIFNINHKLKLKQNG